MNTRTVSLLLAALAVGPVVPVGAGAQPAGDGRAAVGACDPILRSSASRPGWPSAQDGKLVFSNAADGAERIPPLWSTKGDTESITLEELAHRAAPILIFSPLEFLKSTNGGAFIPSTAGKTDPVAGDGPFVYYRVREVRVDPKVDRTRDDALRKTDTRWSCAAEPRIDTLRFVIIRYFFYYPRDAGIGGHKHDLEALEVQIRPQAFCEGDDREGACFYALTMVSAAASAHGVGWYTNILQVEDTDDTVLPLSVLVERDKHATSPDRDGNGSYMPNYDTNRYTKDAWGVRDVVATGWLGGAAYRAEFSDDRRDGDRLYPPKPLAALKDLYSARLKRPWGSTYQLAFSEAHPLCRTAFGTDEDGKHLKALVDGKNFCGTIKPTRISRPGSYIGAVKKVFWTVSPGPASRYGFMQYVQRLSFAGRYDGRWGASSVLPLGREVPLFGGWLVSRVFVMPDWKDEHENTWLKTLAVEGLYAPSGSRVHDWYLVAGAEGTEYAGTGKREWGPSAEVGVKFRFNYEDLRRFVGFEFAGVRIALRTSAFKGVADESGARPTIRNTRLVFEVGAGAW